MTSAPSSTRSATSVRRPSDVTRTGLSLRDLSLRDEPSLRTNVSGTNRLAVGRPQGLQERLGRLRTRDAVLAVDDEERDSVRAQPFGFLDVVACRVDVLTAVQHGTC